MYACLDLIDLTEGIDLPAEVRCHNAVRHLSLMAINVVCWSNDILSLSKELQRTVSVLVIGQADAEPTWD